MAGAGSWSTVWVDRSPWTSGDCGGVFGATCVFVAANSWAKVRDGRDSNLALGELREVRGLVLVVLIADRCADGQAGGCTGEGARGGVRNSIE